MNFFQRQDQARRRTRWLVVLFVLAVAMIILLVNGLALLVFGQAQYPDEPMFTRAFLGRHLGVIVWSTALTAGIIALGTLYRTLSLRGGGGVVARELGGVPVAPDSQDPLRRRLRNVVEEMAIASGVPVPEVYVLEHEPGINAFAAGYSTADAAVAVTRGALEYLDRRELQGVVAHEFGHILNGDMRLNIRLMGVLFGILVMAVIGRTIVASTQYPSLDRTRRGQNTGAIVLIGVVIVAIGYVGLFFGRWIKAMVSRQREFLADASAVQFTRQPEGIAGALKKIAAARGGSGLNADTEEMGHMLFASGDLARLFATHPPLLERIRAIEPGFNPEELKAVQENLRRHVQVHRASGEDGARETRRMPAPGGLPVDAHRLLDQMGQPGIGQVLAAALLVAAIPRTLERAAHSTEWAPELICYLLLNSGADVRDRQLRLIAEALGADSESQVRHLLETEPRLSPELRIPLMEMAFPALRRRPEEELTALLALADDLIHADGRVDVFEYALARMLEKQLSDALRPARVAPGGRRPVTDFPGETRDLLGILAYHGHPADQAAGLAALQAGLAVLQMDIGEAVTVDQEWPDRLDAALVRLDSLHLQDKERLLHAMVVTITHGGETVVAEAELLRAVCAVLHMPLPLLVPEEAG